MKTVTSNPIAGFFAELMYFDEPVTESPIDAPVDFRPQGSLSGRTGSPLVKLSCRLR